MAVHLVDCDYAGLPGSAAAYIVTHDDGAMIIETNTARATDRILAALGGLDLTPADVTHVIITHVHLDHAGGASALLVASATQVYGTAVFSELYGTIDPIDPNRVETMDDEETLIIGGHTLRFLHTRGHANHHFCIVDEAEEAIFTGDSFGIRYPGLQGVIFPSTSPTDFDAALAVESVERIVQSGAKEAWLTHFGVVRDLSSAGATLIGQLRAYGELVDRADDSGAEGDALQAMCSAFVDQFFADLVPGATTDQIALLDVDRSLNAQGLAVAVERRRKRRARGA